MTTAPTVTPALATPAPDPSADRREWTPLAMLRSQYDRNLAAIASRDAGLAARVEAAAPARPWFVAAHADRVDLAAASDAGAVEPRPNPVPPAVAQRIVAQLFPAGACTEAVLVAGMDQGWLWDALYRLECQTACPMHRPPLYFLAHDASRLWAALHLHDWHAMLADARVNVFAGADAVAQYQRAMSADPRSPLARLALTVEPALWQAGTPQANADGVFKSIMDAWEQQLQQSYAHLAAAYPPGAAAAIADRVASGRPLRVMGITSRYTTFLQHSMRDWLAAFEAAGHATRLVIERADHESMTNVVYLREAASFRPDLVVMIDHYRAEFAGLPEAVPCVMYVQDRLPNLFRPAAGAAQGPLDFCLGFGRMHLSTKYGYPTQRFLTAPVGVNEVRFAPGPADPRFACEASFVSHHGTPADVLLARQVEQVRQPEARRLFADVFERMRAHYEAGGPVLIDQDVRAVIRDAAGSLGLSLDADQAPPVEQFFVQQIGNALFRHAALKWVADAGVDLHLYGRGWDAHPAFKRYARGLADNATDLAHVYRSSRINLQVTPFGAVHQRLLDGLAAGGFFLLRHSPGDEVGRHYRALWDWCLQHDITDDARLTVAAASDPTGRRLVDAVLKLEGYDFRAGEFDLYGVTRAHADADFMVAASSIWDVDYDRVAFRTAAECGAMLKKYLSDDAARREVASRMRAAVIDRASYASINRRLLAMIGQNLATSALPTAVAA